MSSAAEILRAFGGPMRGNFCFCPAHDDRNTPNLKVTERNGKVLVKCFAGCPQEAVIDALKQRGFSLTRTGRHRVRLPEDAGSEPYGRVAEELLDAAEEVTERPKAYLRRRGIKRIPPSLKLVGSGTMHFITGKTLPAMIARVTDKDGRSIGAHVTFLTADGKGIAVGKNGKIRRMYGKIAGGLAVLKDADPDKPFIIGEGIETVLSAMQITGLPGAAALSASNLPNVDPPPCSEVIIAADADRPGMEAAEQLADRLAAAGQKVRIAVPSTPGKDWNDELNTSDDTDELKRQILEAPLYQAGRGDREQVDFLLPSSHGTSLSMVQRFSMNWWTCSTAIWSCRRVRRRQAHCGWCTATRMMPRCIRRFFSSSAQRSGAARPTSCRSFNCSPRSR